MRHSVVFKYFSSNKYLNTSLNTVHSGADAVCGMSRRCHVQLLRRNSGV